jgi:hypothetical protein
MPATADSPDRTVHLVGSTPFADADEALDVFVTELGPRLRTVPDGETGDRQNWIQGLIDSFRTHPKLEETRSGDFSDYDRTPVFRVRRGQDFTSRDLDLGYLRNFDASWPRFAERRIDGQRFQVGIPGDLDLAVFTFGNPVRGLRYRSAFRNATLRDIRAIHEKVGDAVVYQQEVPFELVVLTRTPGPLGLAATAFLAGGMTDLARRAPEGTRWGIHLCLGDMNHRALGHLRDVGPIVRLANAIVDRWPDGRSLDFIHAPLAAANEPPPLEPEFYAPLRELRLPADTRFIAGFVHEDRTLEEQRTLLAELDALVGRPVDVACSCGLGRRSREDALRTIAQARELVDGKAVPKAGKAAKAAAGEREPVGTAAAG